MTVTPTDSASLKRRENMNGIINLEPLKIEIQSLLVGQPVSVITSQNDYSKAGDLAKLIQNKIKQIEDKRLQYTRPLDESKRMIMADFKSITEPLENLVFEIKEKMIIWHKAEQKRLDEEQKRIEIEAMAKLKSENKAEVSVPVVNEIKTQRGDFSTSNIRKVWKWRIVSFSKLGDEFKTTNDIYINQKVREGVRQIEGLEIYQEENLNIR